MSKSKKIFFTAILLADALFFAQETKSALISFSNELGSDVINVTSDDTTFAGFYNEAIVDVTHQKVDVGIDALAKLSTDDSEPKSLAWTVDDFDWYMRFRPIDVLSLEFHDQHFMAGSYLPIEDDNIAGVALGSTGFTLACSAITNLTIATTIPFDMEDGSTDQWENIGFGAEYNFFDKGTLGFVIRNVANDEDVVFGASASLTIIDGLSIGAGYSTSDDEGLCDISGDNVINASALYEAAPLTVGIEGIVSEDNYYIAAMASYAVTDIFTPSLTSTVTVIDDVNTTVIKPCVVITKDSIGEFQIEADITFVDSSFDSLCFPIYWKYSF